MTVFFLSFRVDMLHEYNEYMLLFFDFMNVFDCFDYVVTFEDKTKAGLATKPHFHGLVKIEYAKKVESIRDKFKKFFNETGHTGTHSQIQIIEDIDEYNKALMYILKYGDVEITDIDDIDALIKLSEEYNKQIRQDKLYTWKEHEPFIYEVIRNHFKLKPLQRTRYTMLKLIHNYIYDWNHSHDESQFIKRYANSTIMNFIYNTEMRLLSKDDSLEKFLEDFSRDTTCHPKFYDNPDPLEYQPDALAELACDIRAMEDDKEHMMYENSDEE